MADMKVVACAKIVNTTQKASIVINASQNTIDHMENNQQIWKFEIVRMENSGLLFSIVKCEINDN